MAEGEARGEVTSAAKKRKLAPAERFKGTSDQDVIDEITKGYIPANTMKSTAWAMKVFYE